MTNSTPRCWVRRDGAGLIVGRYCSDRRRRAALDRSFAQRFSLALYRGQIFMDDKEWHIPAAIEDRLDRWIVEQFDPRYVVRDVAAALPVARTCCSFTLNQQTSHDNSTPWPPAPGPRLTPPALSRALA